MTPKLNIRGSLSIITHGTDPTRRTTHGSNDFKYRLRNRVKTLTKTKEQKLNLTNKINPTELVRIHKTYTQEQSAHEKIL